MSTKTVLKLRALIDIRRKEFGSMTALAIASGFPMRTLQDWCYGKRTPREYVISTVVHQLETLKPPRANK